MLLDIYSIDVIWYLKTKTSSARSFPRFYLTMSNITGLTPKRVQYLLLWFWKLNIVLFLLSCFDPDTNFLSLYYEIITRNDATNNLGLIMEPKVSLTIWFAFVILFVNSQPSSTPDDVYPSPHSFKNKEEESVEELGDT